MLMLHMPWPLALTLHCGLQKRDMGNGTEATTACRRCREQKVSSFAASHLSTGLTLQIQLRCSRELPRCARCIRLDAQCGYPPPPDRKQLAAVRATKRKRAAEHEQHLGDSDHEPGRHPSPRRGVVHRDSTVKLPSRGVQRDLLDVYLSYTFNSTLVFDRTSINHEWADGQLSEPVLLAVCAMATVYACLLVLKETF